MRCNIGFFFLLVFIYSCQKKDSYSAIEVYGHAGMGLEMSNSIYHNNSLESIELALSISGSEGVEIDVQQDLDGTLWLFHDETLDKSTNSNGCISNKTTQELENVRYKSLHNEKLLKLSALDFNQFPTKKIFLDLRFYQHCTQSYANGVKFKNALLDIQVQAKENLYLIIPSANYLAFFENDFNVLYANDKFEDCVSLLNQDTIVDGIVIRNQLINYTQVQTIKLMKRNVYLFEMRSPKGIKSALKKHPTGLISDDLRATIIQRRK
jgi:glycerophosphoryl diester phosphodiesterase